MGVTLLLWGAALGLGALRLVGRLAATPGVGFFLGGGHGDL